VVGWSLCLQLDRGIDCAESQSAYSDSSAHSWGLFWESVWIPCFPFGAPCRCMGNSWFVDPVVTAEVAVQTDDTCWVKVADVTVQTDYSAECPRCHREWPREELCLCEHCRKLACPCCASRLWYETDEGDRKLLGKHRGRCYDCLLEHGQLQYC